MRAIVAIPLVIRFRDFYKRLECREICNCCAHRAIDCSLLAHSQRMRTVRTWYTESTYGTRTGVYTAGADRGKNDEQRSTERRSLKTHIDPEQR